RTHSSVKAGMGVYSSHRAGDAIPEFGFGSNYFDFFRLQQRDEYYANSAVAYARANSWSGRPPGMGTCPRRRHQARPSQPISNQRANLIRTAHSVGRSLSVCPFSRQARMSSAMSAHTACASKMAGAMADR